MKNLLPFLFLLPAPFFLQAQFPSLDKSFGDDGKVDLQTNVPEIVVQADKKILVITGSSLIRLLPDGEIDADFGNNGQVPLPSDFSHNLHNIRNHLHIQPDGKIILTSSHFLIRYNENGSKDLEFGEAGEVDLRNFVTNNLDLISDLMFFQDGKFLVAVSLDFEASNNFGVIGLNEDGSLNTEFGENGSLRITNIGSNTGIPNNIAPQPDGNIVLLGREAFDATDKVALARISPKGQVDPSFNNGNYHLTSISLFEPGLDMLILDDGRILIGSSYNEDPYESEDYFFQLIMLDQDGNFDPGFGEGGRIVYEDLEWTRKAVMDIILLPDGRLVFSLTGELAAINMDGSIDMDFKGITGNVIALQGDKLLTVSGAILRRYLLSEPSEEIHAVTKFTLINAQTNEELFEIQEGQVINLQQIATNEINIRAYTDPEPTGSLRFVLSGTQNRNHIENNSYYALFANDGENFFSWEPQLGNYQLTATPFTESGAQGEKGTALTISFSIIDEKPAPVRVEKFTLINAATNQELFEIQEGQVINLQEIGTSEINIRAYTDPEPTGSVRFVLSGAQNRNHIENNAYYALFANAGEDFFSWEPELGDYQLTATPFTESGAQGEKGTALTISFSIIDEEAAPVRVEKFTLINAATNQELFEIQNGQVISLQEIGTNEINIRAYTDPEPTGSVRFVLSGAQNRNHIENNSYYALFANAGEDFFSWTPLFGNYFLTATPYTEAKGQGEEGNPLTVSFSIVGGQNDEMARTADAFPNPGSSTLYLSLDNLKVEDTQIVMFDLAGKLVTDKISLNRKNTRIEIDVTGLESKAYIIHIISKNEVRNVRWMKE